MEQEILEIACMTGHGDPRRPRLMLYGDRETTKLARQWIDFPQALAARILTVLGLILTFGLIARLLLFTGMSLGDDATYMAQIIATVSGQGWPPIHTHWQTRLGVTLPVVLAVKIGGLNPAAILSWPLLTSLAKIVVCYFIARRISNEQTALLAAFLQASFPLDLIYGTHLFPDPIVSLFSTISIWCWTEALRRDAVRWYFSCGATFAIAYLTRETALMDGPIYLGLWALAGRLCRPRLLWVFIVPILTIIVECCLYGATAGSVFYRWSAILAQQSDEGNSSLILTSTSGGNFWTDPLLMLVTSHEFGISFLPSVLVGTIALRRCPTLRPLSLWILIGFFWFSYGTTVPNRWLPFQRDPRYYSALTVPASILLAHWLTSLRMPVSLLLGSGIGLLNFCSATLDQGNMVLEPHRVFVKTDYARDATLEPLEYIGARWSLGLSRNASFSCANDCGRSSILHGIDHAAGVRLGSSRGKRYFVLSPDRRPDLLTAMTKTGWRIEAEIPGRSGLSRTVVARLLMIIPTQRARAERIMRPAGLVVLSNTQHHESLHTILP